MQCGSLCRYLQKARLIVMGRWDATKNSLFPLLNKWALGCDFIAATSDITHALVGAVGRRMRCENVHVHPRICICMHVQTSLLFVCVWHAQLCTCCRVGCKGIRKTCVWIESSLLSELCVWDNGQSFIAFKNAYSAHPTAGLPGNAGYGRLIEFPKRSLYGLSNHLLM